MRTRRALALVAVASFATVGLAAPAANACTGAVCNVICAVVSSKPLSMDCPK
jgi:hypothetical protein